MRFTAIWAETLTQNITLRLLLLALSITSVVLAASTVRLAMRDPLVIERGCVSTAGKPGPNTRTQEEIEAFLRTAVPKRFDSNANDTQIFLSPDEIGFRQKEQQELKTRGFSQRILVNDITVQGSTAKVDTDRVLTAGGLRTAVSFPLTIELSQTDRTMGNPYGLLLNRVSPTKIKEELK